MNFEMGFIDRIKERAKADKKTIVLPESMDKRTFAAAEKVLKEGIANLIIIGTPEEIAETRERAIEFLQKCGYEVVNTRFTDDWYSYSSMKDRCVVNKPLCYVAKSLENMSLCHAAYFCKGWEKARGCRIEHEAAKAYGLDIIYEEE